MLLLECFTSLQLTISNKLLIDDKIIMYLQAWLLHISEDVYYLTFFQKQFRINNNKYSNKF